MSIETYLVCANSVPRKRKIRLGGFVLIAQKMSILSCVIIIEILKMAIIWSLIDSFDKSLKTIFGLMSK